MIKNYFKIGLRNAIKYKVFTAINVFGLAAAMSVCMLIMLMWSDQKAYDLFHQNKDRIYRIVTSQIENSNKRATIPYPTIHKLENQVAEIEDAVTLRREFGGDGLYTNKDQKISFSEMRGYFTNSSFFNVFDFDLAEGDPKSALEKPNSIVITKSIADKLFGKESPIGKNIHFSDRGLNYWTEEASPPVDWGIFTVTGVFAENHQKSHLKFEVMASESSLDLLYKQGKIDDLTNNWATDFKAYGYVMLKEKAPVSSLEKALVSLTEAELQDNENESLKKSRFTFQPLTKITPGEATGNSTDTTLPLSVYYILWGLAFIIMLAACLNYASISIARAVTRFNEIGVRKVIGAGRKDLVFQFLSESLITVFLSLILANFFLIFIKKAFLNLWLNQFLDFDMNFNVKIYAMFLGFTLCIGFVAGLIPALKLSRFSPIDAMKSKQSAGSGKMGFRRVLIVSQFALSMLFIVSAILIYNQLDQFMKFDYGFDSENVVNVNLQSNDYELVKSSMSAVPGVDAVSACAYVPADGRNDQCSIKKIDSDIVKSAIDLSVDANFAEVLKIGLLAGRKMNATSDSVNNEIMVNETAAKEFGYANPSEMVGQIFEINGTPKTVTGVFNDFNFFLLFTGRTTGPIVFQRAPQLFKFATIKITSNNKSKVIAAMEEQWKTIDPIHPMQFEFYEDQLSDNNQAIVDLVAIIGFLAFLAIVIASLGLFGMAIYITERRTKEIGIRKVLGANLLGLNYTLSREFIIMLGIAIAIAAPASFFLNKLWLDYMVVKADFGIGTLSLGALILFIIGLLTIIPQTLKIASKNPVDTLKIE
ncbi:MAG: ABC transporter permease [Saprospiraceae bacterium]|nr:ABC transporter permease [Saprospiraceae bacterium]